MFSYLDDEPDREQVVAKYKAKKEAFFCSLEDKISTKEESKVEGKLSCRDLALIAEDMDKLADLLKNFPNITELSLSYNDFGNDGMKALSKIIVSNKKLKKVWLEYNDIDNDGLLNLISNPEVKERLPFIDVDLSSNKITDEGYIAASKIMSPLSIISIPTGNIIKDQVLREKIRCEAEAKYRQQKNKETTYSGSDTLFLSSSDKALKDKDKLQQNVINKPL